MSLYANKTDFNRAGVGHPFMEACGICGKETGIIILKTSGTRPGRESASLMPRILVNPDSRCEFCDFLEMYLSSEGIDPNETGLKYGAAKLVTVGDDGISKLLAYVPFGSDEDLGNQLSDGTPFRFQHRTIIRCEEEDGGLMKLVEIIERGG